MKRMSNKMRKIVGALVLIIGIMMQMGITANAVYNEEKNTIDYNFVAELAALGMSPDCRLEMGEDGMIWTRTCSIADMLETAERYDGESGIEGDGTVYMWYSVEDNIGTLTITGDFTYYWAEDEEAVFHYYQVVFECDEDGDIAPMTEVEEIYW